MRLRRQQLNLLPAIAPDLLASGCLTARAATCSPYSFDAVAHSTAGLLERLNVSRFATYVQDYGAPVGCAFAP